MTIYILQTREYMSIASASSNHRDHPLLLCEVMLGMCFDLFQLRHALILPAACWLLSASRGCCFLPLCPGSSCLGSCELRLRIVQPPGLWSPYPACWLLPVWGLEKAWERVCPSNRLKRVIGDPTAYK